LDVLFDIDWQGAQELAERARGDLVSVFVLPPSMNELHRRLTTRAQDSAEVVAGRMSQAADEISHWAEYDYVLVNDVLEDCFAELQRIVNVERLRRTRQTWLTDFVRGLRVDTEESS
jgi:guanylate kinase